jgi:triosephosphate isomerase
MAKRVLLIGNWKMNLNASQASILVHRLHERIRILRDVEVVLCPSMLVLQPMSMQIDRRKFRLGAQNAYSVDEGAYTGEVSFMMLQDLVHYVIVGHSERRHVFGESHDLIRDKVAAAVRNGIAPILCVGETKTEKAVGEATRVVHDQIVTALAHLTAREVAGMVIAYEPVWAISSGKDFGAHEVATPEDVAKVIAKIRHAVESLYGARAAKELRVLYGGSTNADNAGAFLRVAGCDGLLVGGASLNYEQFSKMVATANIVANEEA